MVNIQHSSSSVVVVYIRLLYIYICVCVCSFPYHLHVKGKRRQTARKWKERNCYEEPDSPASPMFLGAGRRIGASQPTQGWCGAGATSAKKEPKGREGKTIPRDASKELLRQDPDVWDFFFFFLSIVSLTRLLVLGERFKYTRTETVQTLGAAHKLSIYGFEGGEYVYTYRRRSSQKRGNPILKLWVDVWVVVVVVGGSY